MDTYCSYGHVGGSIDRPGENCSDLMRNSYILKYDSVYKLRFSRKKTNFPEKFHLDIGNGVLTISPKKTQKESETFWTILENI